MERRESYSLCAMFCVRSVRTLNKSNIAVRSFSALSGMIQSILLILIDAVLVRDFIKDCLYNTEEGYNKSKKVGILEKPIEFGSLWGKWEFNKTIKEVYDVKYG